MTDGLCSDVAQPYLTESRERANGLSKILIILAHQSVTSALMLLAVMSQRF